MNKKYYIVLDTETVGIIPRQIVYDVGWIIADRNGHIYERFHFLVREIFTDLPLMATAHYAKKFPEYIERLQEQNIKMLSFAEILIIFNRCIEKYHITTLAAYNLSFDLRAMENTCDLLFDNRNWYNANLDKLCIMCAACDVLYNQPYIKMCRKNGWITEKGNVKCSAETGYRFITKNPDFEEEHRGLDDCEIELQILLAILKKHKKFDGTPKAFPMRKVYAKERVKVK